MKASLLAQTRELLRRHAFHPKRSLGQSFLIDSAIVEEILRAATIDRQEAVIEIGPGLGALTQPLCWVAGRVLAIELDPVLSRILATELQGLSNLHLVQADVLAFDFASAIRPEGLAERAKVVANIPYHISTPLLFHLLKNRFLLPWWVLMVQEEVGERILASPGSKRYGSLSVALQLHGEISPVVAVPKEAFYPRPQVDSLVLKIVMLPRPRVEIKDEILFRDVVRAAFGQRRKMLGNALAAQLGPWLKKEMWARVFADAGISPQRRGETLCIEEFARLADHLHRWLGREGHVSHRQG